MNTINSISFRTLIAGVFLSAMACSFPTASSADERTTLAHSTVKFADLDLSTSQGALALYDRIHRVAVKLCLRVNDSDLAYRLNQDACLHRAIADAVTRVNQPELSAVFASKYRATEPTVLAAAGAR